MKLLLHPGGALFVLAGLAFLVWLLAPSIPVLGGFVRFAAFFAMIFGVIGGLFLTFVVKKAEGDD